MTPIAAGILPYTHEAGQLEVFIVHPGGPYFERHDEGVWSAAKGIIEPGESHEQAARREFSEEVGCPPPPGSLVDLGTVKLRSGKVVQLFAVEADRSLEFVESNQFELEWPKRSGKFGWFHECDRGEWCGLDVARIRLSPSLHPFLDRLVETVASAGVPAPSTQKDM